MTARARLRLVDALPATALRAVAVASFKAARQSVARGRNEPLRLSPLAASGYLLTLFHEPAVALEHVEGADDWACKTRGYLQDIQRAESAKPITSRKRKAP
jgi:hypothetical protein